MFGWHVLPGLSVYFVHMRVVVCVSPLHGVWKTSNLCQTHLGKQQAHHRTVSRAFLSRIRHESRDCSLPPLQLPSPGIQLGPGQRAMDTHHITSHHMMKNKHERFERSFRMYLMLVESELLRSRPKLGIHPLLSRNHSQLSVPSNHPQKALNPAHPSPLLARSKSSKQ